MEKAMVFISYKNSDGGIITEDAHIAESLYKKLEQNHIPTFYSNVTLHELGESHYKEAIEDALDSAVILLLIGTKVDYIQSKWVKYEWDSFHEEILADAKENAIIIPYLSETIGRNEKPRALRNMETFLVERDSEDKVVSFIINYLTTHGMFFEDYSKNKFNAGIDKHSSYSALAADEERRLAIQCELTRDSDLPAIQYALEQFKEAETIYIMDIGCAGGKVMKDRFQNLPYSNLHVVGIDRCPEIMEVAKAECAGMGFHFANIEVESDDFEEVMEAYMKREGIPGFHLVTSTVFLRHLQNPQLAMERIHKILVKDGYFMIREQDDSSILSCGDNGLIQKLLERHLSVPGVSDHFYGHKVYAHLLQSGFESVKSFHRIRDISDKSMDERLDIFQMAFIQRINFARQMLEEHPEDVDLKNTVDWLGIAVEKVYQYFLKEEFWYSETDWVFLGKK